MIPPVQQSDRIIALEGEVETLKEQVAEMTARLDQIAKVQQRRVESDRLNDPGPMSLQVAREEEAAANAEPRKLWNWFDRSSL